MMFAVSDAITDSVHGRRRTLAIGRLKLPWPFQIAYWLSSSSAVVFGWPVYGAKPPLYVKVFFRAFRRIEEANRWIQYRFNPQRRYHMVRTGLEPGYYDCDTLMLHACMALLCRYVEDESGGDAKLEEFTKELEEPGSEGHGPREAVDSQASRQSEAITIYRWWKVQRPADQKRREELGMLLYADKERVSFKPVMDGKLSEMVFKEFEGNEIAMEKEFRSLEQKIDDDEDAMLHRLMDIRRSLWT